MRNRLMPERVNLGQSASSTMSLPMMRYRDWKKNPERENPHGLRTIMGFCLPSWQRGLVWTREQKVSFIESAWLGVPLGTYTYNQTEIGHPMDNVLIDGQQRMSALQSYLDGEFQVFGHRWSEVSDVDRRVWDMSTVFASFITKSTDESYLRGYYDLMNFGGTPHLPAGRASFRKEMVGDTGIEPVTSPV